MPKGSTRARQNAADFLSVEQAAQRLSVSKRTVHRMIERGDLGVMRTGRVFRIPIAELDRLVSKATHDAAAIKRARVDGRKRTTKTTKPAPRKTTRR